MFPPVICFSHFKMHGWPSFHPFLPSSSVPREFVHQCTVEPSGTSWHKVVLPSILLFPMSHAFTCSRVPVTPHNSELWKPWEPSGDLKTWADIWETGLGKPSRRVGSLSHLYLSHVLESVCIITVHPSAWRHGSTSAQRLHSKVDWQLSSNLGLALTST